MNFVKILNESKARGFDNTSIKALKLCHSPVWKALLPCCCCSKIALNKERCACSLSSSSNEKNSIY